MLGETHYTDPTLIHSEQVAESSGTNLVQTVLRPSPEGGGWDLGKSPSAFSPPTGVLHVCVQISNTPRVIPQAGGDQLHHVIWQLDRHMSSALSQTYFICNWGGAHPEVLVLSVCLIFCTLCP